MFFWRKGGAMWNPWNPVHPPPSPMNFAWIPRRREPVSELEVEITDTVLRSTLSTPLRIPIRPPSDQSGKDVESSWFTRGETTVYSGASDGSPALATLSPGVALQGDRQFGEWARVTLAGREGERVGPASGCIG